MQLHINITDESKAIFLLELLRSLDYVHIIDEFVSPIIEQETEIDIDIATGLSNEQITELDQRIEEFESGKTKIYSWQELKQNLIVEQETEIYSWENLQQA